MPKAAVVKSEFPCVVWSRLSRTERALLERMAKEEQMTISGAIRECVIRHALQPLFPRQQDGGYDPAA